MEILTAFLDIVLHLDAHLLALVQEYGLWIYAILFAIIFAETGLVVAPFLPGDSLLFVIGALCGMGSLELQVAMPLLILAAFMGDNTNYWIGRLLGLRLLNRASMASGARTLLRAAASSIASGSPSRRTQISAMAGAVAFVI